MFMWQTKLFYCHFAKFQYCKKANLVLKFINNITDYIGDTLKSLRLRHNTCIRFGQIRKISCTAYFLLDFDKDILIMVIQMGPNLRPV